MRIKNNTIAFYLLLLLIPLSGSAQDVSTLLHDAKQLELSFHDNEALAKYLAVLAVSPGNFFAVCKVSELYNLVGKRQKTKEKEKEYYLNAKKYADRALKLNPNSPESNFVMALAMGRMAIISSGSDRIKAVKDIKTYADRCVKLDPNSFKGYHILGRWNYEVSDLNALEKVLVRITYGSLPPASLDESIRCYEKSMKLNPAFLLNYLELAKAYRRKDEERKSIELLNTMLRMPPSTADDVTVKKVGRELLQELQ